MEQSLVEQIMALGIPGIDEGIAELLSHYPDDLEALATGGVPYNLDYKLGASEATIVIQNIERFQELKLPPQD
jgi:hypothetical protein